MNDDFEKGLQMLLQRAYHAPTVDEKFRERLLDDLRLRQQLRAARNRRMHHYYLLSGGLLAAAALFTFTFLPLAHLVITPSPSAQSSEDPAVANTANLIGKTAIALQPLNVKAAHENDWKTLSVEEKFTLTAGLQIRTPVGSLEDTGFGVVDGPAVMLVGMSNLKIGTCGGLKVLDGQAMLDLSRTNHAYNLVINEQKFALQPGAMVLLGVDYNPDYAVDGSPAPVLALLHGRAASISQNHEIRELAAGRVYELYDTGTGIFPSRDLSYSENQRRFMPMIDAIRAANVQSW